MKGDILVLKSPQVFMYEKIFQASRCSRNVLRIGKRWMAGDAGSFIANESRVGSVHRSNTTKRNGGLKKKKKNLRYQHRRQASVQTPCVGFQITRVTINITQERHGKERLCYK